LTGTALQQVFAAHHLRYPGCDVIYGAAELIGKALVGSADDEVAAEMIDLDLLRTGYGIVESNDSAVTAQPDTAHDCACRHAITAVARIAAMLIQCCAAAGAGVGVASSEQLLKRCGIHLVALTLIDDRCIRAQAEMFQRGDDASGAVGLFTLRINVVYAQQPATMMMPGLQEAGQRSGKRTEVQGTGG